jgi:hypothetical protein
MSRTTWPRRPGRPSTAPIRITRGESGQSFLSSAQEVPGQFLDIAIAPVIGPELISHIVIGTTPSAFSKQFPSLNLRGIRRGEADYQQICQNPKLKELTFSPWDVGEGLIIILPTSSFLRRIKLLGSQIPGPALEELPKKLPKVLCWFILS